MKCGTFSRFLAVLALLAVCGFSSAQAVDPHSLPPFDTSRTYQVPGLVLEQFRTGLIQLDEQLTQAQAQLQTASERLTLAEQRLADSQDSFLAYKRKTLWTEIGLGTLAVALAVGLFLK